MNHKGEVFHHNNVLSNTAKKSEKIEDITREKNLHLLKSLDLTTI